MTCWRIPAVVPAMGIYAAVLHALNNMDKDLMLVARDDEIGRMIQVAGLINR